MNKISYPNQLLMYIDTIKKELVNKASTYLRKTRQSNNPAPKLLHIIQTPHLRRQQLQLPLHCPVSIPVQRAHVLS
jgi:hypothetical protein